MCRQQLLERLLGGPSWPDVRACQIYDRTLEVQKILIGRALA